MHKTYFKIEPCRDNGYKIYTRQKPCIICGSLPSDFSHQSITEECSANSKVGDDKGLPVCETCHRENEHSVNGGILTLWNTRSGFYFEDKHDLRDYLRVVCYFEYNKYLLEKIKF